MEQLSLEDSGQRPTSRLEAMEADMVRDICGHLPVDYPGCGLPQELH